MTPERKRLAMKAARRALEVRRMEKIPLDEPCCIYDLAERQGVEVRFADLPSMEGIYYPGKPAIIVSSLRPQGRQAFTCAHELGHHVYGHGDQFDELIEDRGHTRKNDPREFEADCFAAALLMPKTAVLKALSERGFAIGNLSPQETYCIASWLGVGYTTLLNHMARVLSLLTSVQLKTLEKPRLPAIRKMLLGVACSEHLVVADERWTGRPIDAQVSDLILLPPRVQVEGSVLELVHADESKSIARAVRPGIGRVLFSRGSWAQFTRISRREFTGMARFRHLEGFEDE